MPDVWEVYIRRTVYLKKLDRAPSRIHEVIFVNLRLKLQALYLDITLIKIFTKESTPAFTERFLS